MENNENSINEKKSLKAKSYSTAAALKLKSDPGKRKSFNMNEAVRTLDLALGTLKKKRFVTGERPTRPAAQGAAELFMDVSSSSNYTQGMDNTSLMSMNFSHYELMRNLSHENCNSDGAFSGNTCNVRLSPADLNVKDEHLERYFRSIEMCSRNYREGGSNEVNGISEK